MLWWWRYKKKRKNGGSDADAELRRSRELLAEAHDNVVRPARQMADRNGFSDIIRDALALGYDKPPRKKGGKSRAHPAR